MKNSLLKILKGYQLFREKYATGDNSIMQYLASYGQKPQVMVVSCCDSRVDPALILQCDPGDLFVVRNVANIVPPYEKDDAHHGTSAALEFGICFLQVKHLILLGHSSCGGMQALVNGFHQIPQPSNDFISSWVSLIKPPENRLDHLDDYVKFGLKQSLANCLTFPWIHDRVISEKLVIHLWFFDVETGQIFEYISDKQKYQPLSIMVDYKNSE